MTTTDTYTPAPGDQVRVRRYQVPCPELPGHTERKLAVEFTGTVSGVQSAHLTELLHFDPDSLAVTVDTISGRSPSDHAMVGTGDVFLGQDPDHGCSWTLQTEVVPLADVAAHDQAGLDERVALAEREQARALALWERARDAHGIARQRLTGAQERLEAAMRTAARHQADLAQLACMLDLGALSERRKADRAVMAEHVAQLARSHGLSAVVTGEQHGTRRTSVDLAGPHTLGLTVTFRGDMLHEHSDTYVLSWHMRPWTEEGKGWQLAPSVFSDVNPYHGTKATDVAQGFGELAGLLARRFAAIADGSAFTAKP